MSIHARPRSPRTQTFWIAVAAIAAAAFAALHVPAAAPPNLERALASQRALAAERPDDPQVLNDLGNLLGLAGDTAQAEDAYRRALEIAPDLTSARYNLGLLLLLTERPKEALESFQAVVEADPEHAWAHYQIGVVHDQRGADARAVKHYGRAFRLDPQLAFPEINPHVIQNEHVTEAMLIAYRDLPVVAQVPKAYEEPSRIVELMVPVPSDVPVGEAAATEAGTAGASGWRPAPTFAPGAPGEAAPPTADEAGRVLREEDLQQGGTINQIVVPGGVYTAPRGGTRVPPVRTYTPPPAGTTPEGRQPGAAPTPDPRFVPGIPSTGRLEIELFGPGGDEVAPAG